MWSDVGESRNGLLAVSGKHQLPRLWHGPVQIGSPPLPHLHAAIRFAKQRVKWVVKALVKALVKAHGKAHVKAHVKAHGVRGPPILAKPKAKALTEAQQAC